MTKRLYRSRAERKIWGVCGGIAKRFGIDPELVRFIAVLTLFFAFIGVLIYATLGWAIPLETGVKEKEE